MPRKCIRTIVADILQQRGYEVIDQNPEERHILALKSNGEQMAVVFIDLPKFNVKCMEETIVLMNELDVSHAIVVYKVAVTSQVKKTILRSVDMRIELIAEEDILFNATKHRYQPKSFERLDEKEAEEFKAEYGTQFGAFLPSDAIVRIYDYKIGDVIRVVRNNGHITYRIVKEA